MRRGEEWLCVRRGAKRGERAARERERPIEAARLERDLYIYLRFFFF